MELFTVLDIGGTFVKTAVMNKNGDILTENRVRTPKQGKGEIYELIRQIVHSHMSEYGKISGLALSIPAAVNVETGYVSYTGSITDFVGKKIKDELQDLNIPIEVENDANCAALAEKWKGNAQDAQSFLCVTIGTGIGGAIYMNDGIIHGQEGMAGEFGLMIMDYGRRDIDENLEKHTFSRIASTWNLVNQLNLHFNVEKTGEEWFEKYDNGDQEVAKIVDRFFYQLSLGIINIMHIFAPEKILIGGGISEREDVLSYVKSEISKVPTPIAETVVVEACKQRNKAGLLGALYHFLNRNKIN